MGSANKQKLSSYNLLVRENSSINPLSTASGGRQVRNFLPRKGGYLERKTAAQPFIPDSSSSTPPVSSAVRRIIDFRYQDPYGGDHQETLWVKANGRIYRKQKGGEIEIYPNTRFRPTLNLSTVSGGSTATQNPERAFDDDEGSFATLDSAAVSASTETYFGVSGFGRTFDSLSLVIRTEVVNTPTQAFAQYSTDNGTNFTTIYDVAAARALQNDTVTLSATTDITQVRFKFSHTDAAGLASAQHIYDCRLEATWEGAKVLANPRDTAWVVTNNKLFISDGDQTLVYLGQRNGGGWYVWGMPRPDTPTVATISPGNLTLSTGRKFTVTWAHIENGITIHESSRSNISACLAVSNRFYRIFRPVSPPERATHWRVYCSPLDGAQTQFRTATVPITQLSYDDESPDFGEVGSNIQAIAAPINNDPPPKSTVLELHKSRIFAHNGNEKNELWFSALGEVRAFGNGAAEESFPGLAITTQSLLQNFVDAPDQTSETVAAKSWANVLWFFNRKEGFVLTGDGGLLDNSPIRDFWPSQAFRIGCAGPQAITTTPYGMAWVTPYRNLVMYAGGGAPDPTGALIDLGYEKQKILNQISDDELERAQILFYPPLNSLVLRFTTFDSVNHLLFYSFDIQDSESGITGGWYEFTDVDATAIGTLFDRNKEFLLVGEADGEIRVIEQVAGNTVIGKSKALIGKIVLGASSNITNYPAATFRTANTNLQYDGTKDIKKVYVYPHRQSVSDDAILSQNVPTVQFWDDVLDPDNPGSGTSVTLSTATKTRNFRGHLGSAGGTLADRVMVETAFATGAPEGTADGNDFLECYTSRLNGLAIVYAPKEEEFPNP